MNLRRSSTLCVLLAGAALISAVSAESATMCCPFCAGVSLTLGEQYSKSDAAVLVQWVSGEKPSQDKSGNTVYEIVQAPRAPFKSIEKGKKITLPGFRTGKKGDLALLLGSRTKGEQVEWSTPLDMTETGFNYVTQAPGPESAADKRLGYYLKFLEYPDPMISSDAYQEFANAPYKEVVALAGQFPRELLSRWVVSKEVPQGRIGLYGMMLGLCGNDDDALVLESKITEETDDFRLGIDGLIGGYLLLTRDKGLAVIEKTKLANPKAPFSETFAAMQALRFTWTYGNGRIAPEKIQATMRVLLDRPDVADLVIADLARWKDWSIQERLMELYTAEDYSLPSIKRAIIRFMIASTKDVPQGQGEKPSHAVQGAKFLQQLREKDPKMVSEAERFFFLQ